MFGQNGGELGAGDTNGGRDEVDALFNPMDINEPIEGILISDEEVRLASIL